MQRLIVSVLVCAGLAALFPQVFERYADGWLAASRDASTPAAATASRTIEPARTEPRARYLGGRSTVLSANPAGHFTGTFRINGRPVDGMIDTGATAIAMNAGTARRVGVSPAPSDYIYPVQTANGETRAAHVTLERIEIGGVRADDVDAFVLDDAALSQTLIGMTFLQKMKSYQVRDEKLYLSD